MKLIIFLQTLDVSKLAEEHLRKTIARVKSVSAHATTLPKSVREGDNQVHSKEALNVLARLYKAQAVKNTMDHLIDDLKTILGVAPIATKDVSKDDGKKENGRVGARAGLDKKKVKAPVKESSEDEEAEDTEEVEFSGFESDDLAAFESRLAGPSSDEESGAEDSSTESARIYPPSITSSVSGSEPESDSDGISISDAASVSGLDSDSDSEPPVSSKLKAKAAVPLTEKPAKSTFIPSLTMGGYMSGSESEASDLDELVAPRKNRRGQRARQAIWEKKFGESAKHLSKKKDDRNKGWDPKRGAQLDDERGARRGKGRDAKNGTGSKGGRGPRESGANAEPVAKKKTKRDDTGPLHPSWAAAKAAKEKKLSAVPMGKKVVFD